MQILLKTLSWLGLALTIGPAFLYLANAMTLEAVKLTMVIGGALWLFTAPILQKQNQNPLVHPENQDNI